jgi:hypothetical protein
MSRDDHYRVTSDRLISGVGRGEVVRLDPDHVNIPALIAAGHVEPYEPPKSGKSRKSASSEGGSEDVSVQPDGRDGSGS